MPKLWGRSTACDGNSKTRRTRWREREGRRLRFTGLEAGDLCKAALGPGSHSLDDPGRRGPQGDFAMNSNDTWSLRRVLTGKV